MAEVRLLGTHPVCPREALQGGVRLPQEPHGREAPPTSNDTSVEGGDEDDEDTPALQVASFKSEDTNSDNAEDQDTKSDGTEDDKSKDAEGKDTSLDLAVDQSAFEDKWVLAKAIAKDLEDDQKREQLLNLVASYRIHRSGTDVNEDFIRGIRADIDGNGKHDGDAQEHPIKRAKSEE